ncbi:hypothetical protein JOL79_06885 [Microbispora sp. RL4-1S]|uniref:Uncharacterized protein n=1 Tax=Microbispora oryzae TaxID=2806554 RepID=A0A940WF52_9ACTN|nr:hypothetical protein [Microbispora oryzae]MBP2703523.1 hypothetical protein [Microbispora oryzae]
MSIRTTPCDWDVDMGCCPTWEGLPAEQQQFALDVATEILWRLSGRRFGLCELTVRPCLQPCATPSMMPAYPTSSPPGAFSPVMTGGVWLNMACGKCGDECACGSLCEIVLPGPVDSIVEVKLDGAVLDEAEYVVFDHRTLARVPPECWPSCQALTLPDTEVGTWSVTYRQGIPVPPGGLMAAGMLACELGKACSGSSGCKLPKRVQTLTREGVTVGFLDPMSFLTDGLTGLYEVDLWLRTVNPGGLLQAPRVYSPDRRPPRTITGASWLT